MAHKEMQDFIIEVKNKFPNYFKNVKVVDFGSLDINGNNKEFFEDVDYVGVDLEEGENVDVVSLAHKYKSNDKYDVVITTELLEHDIFWKQTFLNGLDLLKDDGLYVFSCASRGRSEHGTTNSLEHHSPFTTKIDVWKDYYENRVTKDFINLLDFENTFSQYRFQYDSLSADLYFYGIKNLNFFKITSNKEDNIIYIKSNKDKNIKLIIEKDGNVIYSNNMNIKKEIHHWVKPSIEFTRDDQITVLIFENELLLIKKEI